MGLFSGMNQASEPKNSKYLPVGIFKLKVKTCKHVVKKLTNDELLAVEFSVLESTSDEAEPGALVSWVPKKTGSFYFLSDVRAFIAAVMGCKFSEVDEDDAEQIVGEEQPLKDREVYVYAYSAESKKTGKAFTKYDWSHQAPESK